MQRTLRIIDQQLVVEGNHNPPPCDSRGNAL